MAAAPDLPRESRFACTGCGACCDRSPEVQLSEAAALADVFVFRLMFRLYELPRTLSGHWACGMEGSAGAFHESKRLTAAFAARRQVTKRRQGSKAVEYTRYLVISALTVDTGAGGCTALAGRRCGIYERRPLACRTVPFHYSRPEASARRELEAFVATPGYRCDTTARAPVVLEEGRIVHPEALGTRRAALELRERDGPWQEAIMRRLKGDSGRGALPGLREIEANAAFGATTISMRLAWQIAADSGLIGAEECRTLIAAQAVVIDRELAAARCTPDAIATLMEMRSEYGHALKA
ncbi:MAG TPA: YkgJ family cysteine cluster protein [Allosphingosinicella sp.]|jgi:Fe-S-cluster containining protein